MPTMTLGQYLKSRRLKLRHTQVQAAEHAEVNTLTWSRWERGQMPTLNHAYKICDYLNVKVDELRRYVEHS
jgi:transcriptional regulator with XRE-family HTH domain